MHTASYIVPPSRTNTTPPMSFGEPERRAGPCWEPVNFVRGGDPNGSAFPRGRRSAVRLVGSSTFSLRARRPKKDCGVPNARSIWTTWLG